MLVKSTVKYIQSLSDKKLRDAEGVFLAEGPKVVEDLLHCSTTAPVELFATAEWIKERSGLFNASALRSCREVSEGELQRISAMSTPNQVLGIFKKPEFDFESSPSKEWLIMLDGIQDPGNMGTILRCADWFGVRTIIAGEGVADPYGPKTVQASMGSVGRVKVVIAELETYLSQMKEAPVYAAVLDGKDIAQFGKKSHGILLIGNESKGIRSSLLGGGYVQKVTIPRKGQAESLNASVAAGILLYHFT